MEETTTTYRASFHPHDENNTITWNRGCPILIEEIQVFRHSRSGEAFLVVRARNISGSDVSSFDAAIAITSADGSTEKRQVEALCCDIAAGCAYESPELAISISDVVSSTAEVGWAKLADGSEWAPSAPAEKIDGGISLNLSSAALSERTERLRAMGCREADIAAKYATESHEEEWFRCPCGQLNVGLDVCRGCGLSRLTPPYLESEEFLLEAAAERATREKEAQEIKDTAKARRRRARKRLGIATLAICAVAIVGAGLGVSYFNERFTTYDEPQGFAVFSADDCSLTFYKDKYVPNEGVDYKGKRVSGVYAGVEETEYSYDSDRRDEGNPGWLRDGFSPRVKSVSFEAAIQPASCSGWFAEMENCTSIDLKNLDTSLCKSFRSTFNGCSSLKGLDVSNLDTRSATSFDMMFRDCDLLGELDVSNFETGNATSFYMMFYSCEELKRIDVSGFNTSAAESMQSMFSGCESLSAIDVSDFNTEKVTTFNGMFSYCYSLKQVDLSGFDMGSATHLSNMFLQCKRLEEVKLGELNTAKAISMNSMFSGCEALSSLEVSGFDVSHVENFANSFSGCSSLTDLTGADLWDVSSGKDFYGMFSNCTQLTLDCSSWTLEAYKKGTDSTFNSNAPGVTPPDWGDDMLAEDTRSSLAPYFETFGDVAENGDYSVSQEFVDAMKSVEVMGVVGNITLAAEQETWIISTVKWTSEETMSETEFASFVDRLSALNGGDAIIEYSDDKDAECFSWQDESSLCSVIAWLDGRIPKIEWHYDPDAFEYSNRR